MKKILFFILSLFILSCSNTERKRMETFEGMESPIVVFAKSESIITSTSKSPASIILMDSKGIMVIFDESDDIGLALIQSYNLGDTLINLK